MATRLFGKPHERELLLSPDSNGDTFFIACCESPSLDGKRWFVFADGSYPSIRLSDDEVSWYFQKRMRGLSPEELKIEQK